MSDQMIFKRYEIKYLLTKEQRGKMDAVIADHMTEDTHGRSTIRSLYCDTPDYLLARRSLEKPFYKEKLRLRSYGPTDTDSTVFLEIKKKYDSVVYKRRIALTESEAWKYLVSHERPDDSQIAHEIDYCMHHYPHLLPRVLLTYEREAFYASDDKELRITFDQNILWRDRDLNLGNDTYGTLRPKPTAPL